jgi:crooked neck
VFEDGLIVKPDCVPLWLAYIDAELKLRNDRFVRSLLNRAVRILPKVDEFWYKFVFMEEALNNIRAMRRVFECWMHQEPDENAWYAYIKMEIRYGEIDQARTIFARLVQVHETSCTWLKWARFEEEYKESTVGKARGVYRSALQSLGEGELMDGRILIAFAQYETRLKEYDHARLIYKSALDWLPLDKSKATYQAYIAFEKQFGIKQGLENVVISRRRLQYEEQLYENPENYKVWLDYAKLEEIAGDPERVRDIYELAIMLVPSIQEKQYWRPYIYLWINYALYEELETKNHEHASELYQEALRIIFPNPFTFSKLWLLAAQFEIRHLSISSARFIFDYALTQRPISKIKPKIYNGYIEMEMQLCEYDRCRILYQMFLERYPRISGVWISYAGLESLFDRTDCVREIYELAITVPSGLDSADAIWKAYIEFEVAEQEYDRARALYERLLYKTDQVELWFRFAMFEVNVPTEDITAESDEMERANGSAAIGRARAVLNRAYQRLKDKGLKKEVQSRHF